MFESRPGQSFETAPFLRGDADADGVIDALRDAVFLMKHEFSSGDAPPCLDAADVNGDNAFEAIPDALHLLHYAFLDGEPPPDPGPTDCGTDPEGNDDGLDCARATCVP